MKKSRVAAITKTEQDAGTDPTVDGLTKVSSVNLCSFCYFALTQAAVTQVESAQLFRAAGTFHNNLRHRVYRKSLSRGHVQDGFEKSFAIRHFSLDLSLR